MTEQKNPEPKKPSAKMTMQKAAEVKLQEFAEAFDPTDAMLMARARLHNHMSNHPPLVGTVDVDYIEKYSGSRKIRTWIEKSPEFVYWILDKDFDEHSKAVMKHAAIALLMGAVKGVLSETKVDKDGIAYDSPIAVKDRVKAAELLLNYTDAMPSKRKEVKWLDESIGKLSEADVDKKMEAARKRIAGDEPIDS